MIKFGSRVDIFVPGNWTPTVKLNDNVHAGETYFIQNEGLMNRPRLTPSVIPNLFTAINMFCGFLSILSASEGNFNYAACLIFIAAVFDALDGLVARLTNSSSELGVELDSLSDIVSFGAAPSFLLYKTFFYSMNTGGIIISAIPLIAGVLDLHGLTFNWLGFQNLFFLAYLSPLQR